MFTDVLGEEYAEPQVYRHRKPGRHLQKDGSLLGKEVDRNVGYFNDRGVFRPVVDDYDFELAREVAGHWKPMPPCVDSNCPCFNCACCFTQTVLCTVQDTCLNAMFETSTITLTTTTTRVSRTYVSVTAQLTFTETNTAVFRFTSYTTTTAPPVTMSAPPIIISVTTTQTIVLSTTTRPVIDSGVVTAPGSITISISTPFTFDTTLYSGISSIDGGTVSTSTTTTRWSTSYIFTKYTVLVTATTVTSTVRKTSSVIVTPPTTTVTSTPVKVVETDTITSTTTLEETSTRTKCTGVETVRITPTTTILRSIGTIKPNYVPGCPNCPPY